MNSGFCATTPLLPRLAEDDCSLKESVQTCPGRQTDCISGVVSDTNGNPSHQLRACTGIGVLNALVEEIAPGPSPTFMRMRKAKPAVALTPVRNPFDRLPLTAFLFGAARGTYGTPMRWLCNAISRGAASALEQQTLGMQHAILNTPLPAVAN